MVENWRGSGRTMMRVFAKVPEGTTNLSTYQNGGFTNLSSSMTLTYRQYNTFANVADNGRKVVNHAAYESLDGPLNKGMLDTGNYSMPPGLMDDLNNDGPPKENEPKRFMYTSAYHEYIGAVASILGIDKAVSSVEHPEWRNTTQATEGGNYSYRLRFQNGTDTTAKDIILYDLLETAHGVNPHWKGSLLDYNILQPQGKGIDVKVYYASHTDFTLSPVHLDSHIDKIWKPLDSSVDLSTVKAIAFDLRRMKPAEGADQGEEYLLPPSESLQITLFMRAPVDAKEHILNNHLAYNVTYSDSRKRDVSSAEFDQSIALENCNPVTVSLEDMKLVLDKTSTPSSGSMTDPALVQRSDAIDYILTLKNNNKAQMAEQIKLTDPIPAGLEVNFSGIRATLNDDPATDFPVLPAGSHPHVRMTPLPDSTELTFVVDRLFGGEHVRIFIPTTVSPSDGIPVETKYINKAQVTEVFENPFIVDSPSTYHQLVPVTLQVGGTKEIKGRELRTDDRFTFIIKDETGKVYRTAISEEKSSGNLTNFVFEPTLSFDMAGDYTFTIFEQKGNIESILYDQREFTLRVTVVNESGALKISSASYSLDEKPVEAPHFINHYQSTSHTFNKKWMVPDDLVKAPTPPDIQVQLYRDGEAYLSPATITHPALSHTWENLPLIKADGYGSSVYTSREINPPSHYQSYVDEEGSTVNVYWPGTFQARKLWAGKTPEAGDSVTVTFTLYRTILNDTSLTPYIIPVESIVMDGLVDEDKLEGLGAGESPDSWEKEPWVWEWNTLPANGIITREISYKAPPDTPGEEPEIRTETVTEQVSFEYHVKELSLPANYVIDTASSASTYITNRYVPPLRDVTASKVWDVPADIAEQFEQAYPDSSDWPNYLGAAFQLYRHIDGAMPEAVEDAAIHWLNYQKENTNSVTWTDLPETDLTGKPYTYFVKEVYLNIPDKQDGKQNGDPMTLGQFIKTESGLQVTNRYFPVENGEKSSRPCQLSWIADAFIDYTSKDYTQHNWLHIVSQDLFGNAQYGGGGYLAMHHSINEQRKLSWQIPLATHEDITNGLLVIRPDQEDNWLLDESSLIISTDQTLLDQQTKTEGKYKLLPPSDNITWQWQDSTEMPGVRELVVKIGYMPANSAYLLDLTGTAKDGWTGITAGSQYYAKATFQADYHCIIASKEWVGVATADIASMPPITFQLFRNDQLVDEAVVSPDSLEVSLRDDYAVSLSPFTALFSRLPIKDASGRDYVYTVKELTGEHFVQLGDALMETDLNNPAIGSSITRYNFRNVPLTEHTATKKWEGGPLTDHTAIDLILLRSAGDGESIAVEDVIPLKEGAAPTFSYTWNKLPIADERGTPYTYSVQEKDVKEGKVLVNNNTYLVTQTDNEIVNTYLLPERVELSLSVQKILEGTAMTAGQFNFSLEGGNLQLTATNTATGMVTFPTFALEQVGRYLFTIKEVPGNEPDMQYDNSTYTANVTVGLDPQQNRLVHTLVWLKDGHPLEGSGPVFENLYKTPEPAETIPPIPKPNYKPITVPLSGQKKTVNHRLTAGAYQFVLKDRKGTALETRSNDENGFFSFRPRTLSEPGIYLYTVEEVKGDLTNINYDKTMYTARIVVSVQNGELQADLGILKNGLPYAGEILFVNSAMIPATGDRHLGVSLMMMILASLALGAYVMLRKRDMKN